MDREGVTKGDVGRMLNERYWAEMKRRGLKPYTSFDVRDGFRELRRAWWHRYYRLWILRAHLPEYERKENLRYARLSLAASRACDRPRLPDRLDTGTYAA